MPKFKFRKLNPILVIIISFLILVVFVLVAWAVSLANTSNTELVVAPSSANILIDGQSFTPGSYKLPYGTHDITVSMDGFTTYEGTFNVTDNTKVYIGLMPADGSYTWYLDHPDEQMILNTIGDQNAATLSKDYVSTDPILEHTPYYDEQNLYKVFATIDTDSTIVLSVELNTCSPSSAEVYKSLFTDWLKAVVGEDRAFSYTTKFHTLCD